VQWADAERKIHNAGKLMGAGGGAQSRRKQRGLEAEPPALAIFIKLKNIFKHI